MRKSSRRPPHDKGRGRHGLGLFPQVQRFAEGRGGAVSIESGLGVGTLVRLFLPRVHAAVPGSIVGSGITYTPSPSGGVFHVVNPANGRADFVAGADTRPVQRWSS